MIQWVKALRSKLRRIQLILKEFSGSSKYKLILYELFNMQLHVEVFIGIYSLTIRSSSADLDVIRDGLIDGEYSAVQLLSAKLIVDAGANIGTSAMYFAERFPDAKIIAIEPEKDNYELLVHNVSKYPNVVPIKAALWSDSARKEVLGRDTGFWGYTIADGPSQAHSTGQFTECVSIEGLQQKFNFKHIDLLKMDIEGGERAVLESSKSWIVDVEVMAIELHDRIAMGCDRAFYIATSEFGKFEKNGEKVIAYKVGNNSL